MYITMQTRLTVHHTKGAVPKPRSKDDALAGVFRMHQTPKKCTVLPVDVYPTPRYAA